MFTVNDDLSIYITRGDTAFFSVSADNNGTAYQFQPGDVVRIKVYGKKDAENVVLQKDFAVLEASEKVDIILTERDTKIGEVISKPVDYWYEVELNPLTNPQTIIGYDDDGAKIFKLFPEGADIEEYQPTEEDIPFVDEELDLTSERPVQNQAISRAFVELDARVVAAEDSVHKFADNLAFENTRVTNLSRLKEGSTTGDAELIDLRLGSNGTVYESAGEAVRQQFLALRSTVRVAEVTLLASAWQGSDNLHSQVVTIDGITEYSKVDLLPSVEQLAIFHNKDITFVTENEDGVVTAYVIGDKPTLDYTMQVEITEVLA